MDQVRFSSANLPGEGVFAVNPVLPDGATFFSAADKALLEDPDTAPPFGEDAVLSGSALLFALSQARSIAPLPPGASAKDVCICFGLAFEEGGELFPRGISRATLNQELRGIICNERRRAMKLVPGHWLPGDFDVFCTFEGAMRMDYWLRSHGFSRDQRYPGFFSLYGSSQAHLCLFANYEPALVIASPFRVQLIIPHSLDLDTGIGDIERISPHLVSESAAALRARRASLSSDVRRASALLNFDLPILENAYTGKAVMLARPDDVVAWKTTRTPSFYRTGSGFQDAGRTELYQHRGVAIHVNLPPNPHPNPILIAYPVI